MYQPYPSGGQMPEQPQRPAAPPPVLMAVKLMYAGAVLSALTAIYTAATAGSLKAAILKAHPLYTAAQVHNDEKSIVISAVVVGGLLTTGLWIWMARMNGAGHKWARIVASVLFVINTVDLLLTAAEASSATALGANAGVQVALVVLVWLAGLGAIVLLWRGESSQYLAAASAKDPAA
jgi:hypothetical protein